MAPRNDEIQTLRDEIDGLLQALETRDVIGQAKGILMERHGIGPDDAFALLVERSQNANVKLRDVAIDVASRAGTGDVHHHLVD